MDTNPHILGWGSDCSVVVQNRLEILKAWKSLKTRKKNLKSWQSRAVEKLGFGSRRRSGGLWLRTGLGLATAGDWEKSGSVEFRRPNAHFLPEQHQNTNSPPSDSLAQTISSRSSVLSLPPRYELIFLSLEQDPGVYFVGTAAVTSGLGRHHP
ncbi:uncharacterized protein BDV17DRAFT_176234 [Aspergillus undulatus]|uniref:uncharacterized protein n=1 Tax=Aspergillus undulatus TaxID=1810928 RepID=UPI003CCD64BA